MRFHIMVLAAAMAFSATAGEQAHKNLDVSTILAQQQVIRAEAEASQGRYKDMKKSTRQELFSRQDLVTGKLQGVAYTTDLPEHDQVVVFNALESIEAIVNNAEDERMVCERYKPTGSHRIKTLCMTVAQRREAQEDGKKQINYRDQKL